MSELPKPLTDRNGVVCPYCWKSIDLTDKSAVIQPKPWLKRTWGERIHFHPVGYTHTKCQNCGQESCHAPEEVVPMEPSWQEQKEAYEAQILLLKGQLQDAKYDAKLFAQIADENSPEEQEQPEKLPPDSVHKAPTPPEGPNPQKKRTPGVV